jgi:hypothetical protein
MVFPSGKGVSQFFAAALLIITFASPSHATERGMTTYPDGVDTFCVGIIPPPGLYLATYFLFYNAPRVLGTPVKKTHAEAIGFAPRFIYVSRARILGANLAFAAAIPIVYQGLHLEGANFSDYQFGLGNTYLDPFILGWHLGDLHVATGLEVMVPGTYSPNNPASPSQNYFEFQPAVGLSWLTKWGVDANIKLMYSFPTTNYKPIKLLGSRDYYKSGQSFHFDYCLDYAVRPNLRLGVAGFYYVQTTADIRDGRNIGNHGRQFALGPALEFTHQRFSVVLMVQFEMATINRPEGQRFWFKGAYAF